MSRGTTRASVVAIVVGVAGFSLSGCTFIVDGHPPPAEHRPNTVGQELRDLKTAHDAGAVSEEEYRSAKQRLLASYDKK